MRCPAGSDACHGQPEQPGGDGCDELAYWFSDAVLHPKPPKEPPKPTPPVTLAQLPAACRQVLNAPDARDAKSAR
jgi:penicillin-insensitive murein endopeptidase